MLACIEICFMALTLVFDIILKLIECVFNIIDYFVEAYNNRNSEEQDIINILKAESIASIDDDIDIEDIEITEIEEYTKPSIDILN